MLGGQLCFTEVGDKRPAGQNIRLDAVSFLCPAFSLHVSKSRRLSNFCLESVSFCTADPTAIYYIRKQLPLLANNL